MSHLSRDINFLCCVSTEHKFLLIVADEITNHVITTLLHAGILTKVGEAIVNHVTCEHGV